ncbi:MAG: LysM peptidoglycan-binding domain-containing protein [Planctomycetota bacterium]|jgi:nucleoid-associated protein YgaU
MTRENKVALVVGFALVLFVGILISDHLSDAQTRRSADLAPPAARTAATAGGAGARLLDLQTMPPPRPQATMPTVSPLADPPRARPRPQEIARPAPAAASPSTAPAPAAVMPPAEVRFHDVRPGESLSEIAHRYYGDVHLTDELAQVNGIDDPDELRAGHRLRVPQAGDLAPGQQPAAPQPPDAPVPAYGSYRIMPGDSLSSIAQRCLRSADRWRDLYELNRDVIGDPDNIRVGTVIRIPAETQR